MLPHGEIAVPVKGNIPLPLARQLVLLLARVLRILRGHVRIPILSYTGTSLPRESLGPILFWIQRETWALRTLLFLMFPQPLVGLTPPNVSCTSQCNRDMERASITSSESADSGSGDSGDQAASSIGERLHRVICRGRTWRM